MMRRGRALERIDARLGELLEEMRTPHELDREANRLEHKQTSGSFAQVNREILLELRDHREILLELRDHRTILESIDQGIQSNTRGLLHVFDELRNGRGGPGTAPAA